jgi:hypothetical protein
MPARNQSAVEDEAMPDAAPAAVENPGQSDQIGAEDAVEEESLAPRVKTVRSRS